MKMKLIFAACLAAVLSPGVHAKAVPVDISVNGSYIKTDSEPVIENSTVLAPARAVADALGCDSVSWNEKSKTALFKDENKTIEVTIGKSTALVDGVSKSLKTKAKIINNRTFVPVRFIAESLDAKVSWDSKSYTVDITKTDHSVEDEHINSDYTAEDVSWLAKIVHAEAQGEIMEGKIGVANVVLNRVQSRDFPNNIYNVIFDRKHGVQFTPIANGAIYNNPAKDSYSAAKKALRGENTVGESLYFCNPVISTNSWIMNNRIFHKTIGGHDFYL